MTKPFEPIFREGVANFNEGKFWEAHESWEELWLEASTEMHQFLQGLIQLAAAYHHLKRGTFPGGVRLFDAARQKLGHFPLRFCGIDRTDAMTAAAVHCQWMAARIGSDERLEASEFPRLSAVPADESPLPRDRW